MPCRRRFGWAGKIIFGCDNTNSLACTTFLPQGDHQRSLSRYHRTVVEKPVANVSSAFQASSRGNGDHGESFHTETVLGSGICSAMMRPISRDAVAAGEGALHT
jgi:hypothetical protein